MRSTAYSQLDRLLREGTRTVAPAVACRVEQRGEVVYDAGFGEIRPACPETKVPSDACFDLASLTKLFTATACLRLCTLGILSLDSPVTDILPHFGGERPIGPTEDPITKLPMPTSPHWRTFDSLVDADTVTIRRLLTHTSGLPAWRNVYGVCEDAPAPGYALTRADIAHRQRAGIAAVCGYDFAYPPGRSYTYSDVGLILLGAVVAAVHGSRSLDSALHELVIGPLGLNARFNPPTDHLDRIAPTEYCPWRARRLHGEVHDENAAGLGGIAGHAGLFSTTADLCRLARVYLNDGGGFISPELVRESLRCHVAAGVPGDPCPDGDHPCSLPDPDVRRGLGWMLQTPRGASCGPDWSPSGFGHTGFTGVSLWCDPEYGLALALLTNRVYWGRDPDPIQKLRVDVHTTVADIVRGT